MLIVYGLLALYALEIVVPLLVLAIAYVKRSTRRAVVGTVPGLGSFSRRRD